MIIYLNATAWTTYLEQRWDWWRGNARRRPRCPGPLGWHSRDRLQNGRCAPWPSEGRRFGPWDRNSRPSPSFAAPRWRSGSRARQAGSSWWRSLGRCSWLARYRRRGFRCPSRSSRRECTATPDAFCRPPPCLSTQRGRVATRRVVLV